jgi:hypothetical protein
VNGGYEVATVVAIETVRGALSALLTEIMDQPRGYVLDDGDAVFQTLAGITAEEASRPVSGQSASIAAQVNHLRFYVDAVINREENADWDGSWKVGPVNDAEWQDLIDRLKVAMDKVRAFTETFEDWDERYIGGAIAIIAHCAYHLGEIRQGIGVLRTYPVAHAGVEE